MTIKRKLAAMSEQLESQQRQIHMMADAIGLNKQAITFIENKIEKDEPTLKKLAQSVFDEREIKELTGSDLARDYFKRGCCRRICFVGEDSDECLSDLVVAMVIGYAEDTGFETSYNEFFPYAALVNSYGDELIAKDIGA